MGLSARESGRGAFKNTGQREKAATDGEIKVALAGNPNVGKSTLFNALTGLNQHTGNWSGKTVSIASGRLKTREGQYMLVDIPGTYSLYAHSKEEEVASEFIAFGGAEIAVVVCDATCIARSLSLALGIMELAPRVLVVVNLLDEAEKKGIKIDTDALSSLLGVEVVGVVAKRRRTLDAFCEALDRVAKMPPKYRYLDYPAGVGEAAQELGRRLAPSFENEHEAVRRYIALRLLSGAPISEELTERLPKWQDICKELFTNNVNFVEISDTVSTFTLEKSEEIAKACVTEKKKRAALSFTDRLFTGRVTAFPIMLLLLLSVLYITVTLANYPSAWLGYAFDYLGGLLYRLFDWLSAPPWLVGALLDGVYTVLAEVVSVMLPPMAIFFPLFTLLEDSGYLPRVAYNLDRPFCKVGACGKQSLTMCMGLGCNAAGVVGCRIIDSPRERYLAIITNSLVPCNGKFPTIILLVGCFFTAGAGALSGLISSLALTLVILIGIGATFLVTFILSRTVYRGEVSFFTLELPPFRKPDFVRVAVRSLLDRTVYVLGRAAAVAAPAGFVLWLLISIKVGGVSLFSHINSFFDPLGRLMGLDGVILTAFILGFPANEIVLPLALVGYSSLGIGEALGAQAGEILIEAGWTPLTAVCVILFSLMHWPCSTTLLTIYKETKSLKATALSVLCPTLLGITLCLLLNLCFG